MMEVNLVLAEEIAEPVERTAETEATAMAAPREPFRAEGDACGTLCCLYAKWREDCVCREKRKRFTALE